jgi:adenylate cyclase
MPDDEEIERRFLVPTAPPTAGSGTRVVQGYLPIALDGVTLRVRRYGEATVVTVKHGQGLKKAEREVEIAPEVFDALWPLTEGLRIEKTRHELAYCEATIELDCFEGPLAGLVIAEVEFESVNASRNFEPPDWFGRELTDDESYSNRRLAELDAPPGDAREWADPGKP